MLTPKEIQEVTFVKAVFGGYDMKSVDDFLDEMSTDYITLYNENTNLKSKLRVLVQKLEEYRSKEEALNRAAVQAAATQADAERKAAQAMLSAQQNAAAPVDSEAIARAKAQTDAAIQAELQRAEKAKLVAQNFIQVVETSVSKHLGLLDELKTLDLTAEKKASRPYDYESEPDVKTAPASSTQDVADEISQNIERFYESGEKPDPDETKIHRPDASGTHGAKGRFADLQFGPNYNPRG